MLAGGKGSIFNSIAAAMFIATLTVCMPLIGINPYYDGLVRGSILILAFSSNEIRRWIEIRRVKAAARREAAIKAANAGI